MWDVGCCDAGLSAIEKQRGSGAPSLMLCLCVPRGLNACAPRGQHQSSLTLFGTKEKIELISRFSFFAFDILMRRPQGVVPVMELNEECYRVLPRRQGHSLVLKWNNTAKAAGDQASCVQQHKTKTKNGCPEIIFAKTSCCWSRLFLARRKQQNRAAREVGETHPS